MIIVIKKMIKIDIRHQCQKLLEVDVKKRMEDEHSNVPKKIGYYACQ